MEISSDLTCCMLSSLKTAVRCMPLYARCKARACVPLSCTNHCFNAQSSAASQVGELWLIPAPFAVQASGGVDKGAKDSREEGTNGQLSKQLGQEIRPHFIAPLAALPSHNGALLREGGAGLHQ